MATYTQIGHTKKAHGTRGELKFYAEERYLEDMLAAEVVFLEIGPGKVPYFPEGYRDAGSLLVKFEGIDDRDAAALLTGKPLFLRAEDIRENDVPESDLQFARLVGYELTDTQLGLIGTIRSVEEYPQQEMAVVERDEGELLIPLHPDLIQSINDSGKEVYCTLPDGLLDL